MVQAFLFWGYLTQPSTKRGDSIAKHITAKTNRQWYINYNANVKDFLDKFNDFAKEMSAFYAVNSIITGFYNNSTERTVFYTQGDNNNTEDKQLVPAKNLVGIYKMRFAGAGNIAMFMQSTTGLIICVVLPVLLLVGYDFVRRRIYEKNKQSDTDALLAELEALRAEKKKYRTTVEEIGDEKENAPSK